MTNKEAKEKLYMEWQTFLENNIDYAGVSEAYKMAFKALEQEPKTGYWFVDERPESNREVICSNCEQPIFKYHKLDFDYRPKFCPNCGAKMVEP